MAVLAPMPNASVATAAAVNPGAFSSTRTAWRRLRVTSTEELDGRRTKWLATFLHFERSTLTDPLLLFQDQVWIGRGGTLRRPPDRQ